MTADSRLTRLDFWSWRRDLNPRPSDYKSDALPAELRQPDQPHTPVSRDTTASAERVVQIQRLTHWKMRRNSRGALSCFMMKMRHISFKNSPFFLKKRANLLLLLLFSCSTFSCRTADDARAVATQMSQTAQDLRDYYAAMTEIVEQHEKLEHLQNALLDVPLDEQDIAQLKTTRDELEKRSDMAQSLAELSEAFSGLAGSKAPENVSQSAANLGNALSAIQQLPGASLAPEALQHSGKILTKLAQEHDERRMAKQMDPIMAALSEMFSKEKPAYDSINRTYIVLAQSLALELLQRNQVSAETLTLPALKPFDLAPRPPEEKLPSELEKYARQQIQEKGQAEITAHHAASTDMDQGIQDVSKHVHQLASGEHLTAQSPQPHPLSIRHWISLVSER
jgi:DNA mismatch repair ATPase MutS